jgi:hypothetical protein
MNDQMPTHRGTVIGCDNQAPDGYAVNVSLRETATLWIVVGSLKNLHHGARYSKKNGHKSPRSKWPVFKLDLKSVAVING